MGHILNLTESWLHPVEYNWRSNNCHNLFTADAESSLL